MAVGYVYLKIIGHFKKKEVHVEESMKLNGTHYSQIFTY
jgi:hypothetical protein